MLINYLPEFLQNIDEFKKLFDALEYEIHKVSAYQAELLNGQFIYDCNEKYIEAFEKLLGISAFDDDIDKRRKNIILKFNEKLPYTVFRLKESLSLICGEKNFAVFIFYDEYKVILRINFNSNEIIDVQKLADRMIPANMLVDILKFNTHKVLERFKHSYLSDFSHNELYSSVI